MATTRAASPITRRVMTPSDYAVDLMCAYPSLRWFVILSLGPGVRTGAVPTPRFAPALSPRSEPIPLAAQVVSRRRLVGHVRGVQEDAIAVEERVQHDGALGSEEVLRHPGVLLA